MSLSMSLIEYPNSNDGKYLEKGLCIIESSFINNELLELIISKFPLKKLKIFEEEGSTEYSVIDYIESQENILEIRVLVENHFVKLLDSEECKKLTSVIGNDISTTIRKFRTIGNIYNILQLKEKKFLNINNVIIKIG